MQIYGELFLEDLTEETNCYGDAPFSVCGVGQWLIPLLTGLYLIVANVMLINLLIAMFTSTYEGESPRPRHGPHGQLFLARSTVRLDAQSLICADDPRHCVSPPAGSDVRATSLERWRFQFYELLDEYRDKAVLPAPLSIVALVYHVFTSSVGGAIACCRSCFRPKPQSKLASTKRTVLEVFQEKHTELYMDGLKLASQDEDSVKLTRLESQVDRMRVFLQEMHNQTQRLEKQQRYLASDLTVLLEDNVAPTGDTGALPRTLSMSTVGRVSSRPLQDFARAVLSQSASCNTLARNSPRYPAFERFSVSFRDLDPSLGAWERFQVGHFDVLYQGPAWGIFAAELPLISQLDTNRMDARGTTGLVRVICPYAPASLSFLHPARSAPPTIAHSTTEHRR